MRGRSIAYFWIGPNGVNACISRLGSSRAAWSGRGWDRTTPATVERRHGHVLVKQPHAQRSIFLTDLDEDLPLCGLAEIPIRSWLGRKGRRRERRDGALVGSPLSYAFSQVANHERLVKGESTNNIGILSKLVLQADEEMFRKKPSQPL